MGRHKYRRTKEYAQTGANDHEEHGFFLGVSPLEAGRLVDQSLAGRENSHRCWLQMFSSPYDYGWLMASNLIDGFIIFFFLWKHVSTTIGHDDPQWRA